MLSFGHDISDYVNGGELFTHLYQREKFTEDEVRIYIGEIIIAIEHLHRVSKRYVFCCFVNPKFKELLIVHCIAFSWFSQCTIDFVPILNHSERKMLFFNVVVMLFGSFLGNSSETKPYLFDSFLISKTFFVYTHETCPAYGRLINIVILMYKYALAAWHNLP